MKYRELKEELLKKDFYIKKINNDIFIDFLSELAFVIQNVDSDNIHLEPKSNFNLDKDSCNAISEFMNTPPEERFKQKSYTVVIGASNNSKDDCYYAYSKHYTWMNEGPCTETIWGYKEFYDLDSASYNDLKSNKYIFKTNELEKLYLQLDAVDPRLSEVAKSCTKEVRV